MPNARCSTFVLPTAWAVLVSIASCAPTEPSSTRTTSSATGGTTLTVLKPKICTAVTTRSPPNVPPLTLPEILAPTVLPLTWLPPPTTLLLPMTPPLGVPLEMAEREMVVRAVPDVAVNLSARTCPSTNIYVQHTQISPYSLPEYIC